MLSCHVVHEQAACLSNRPDEPCGVRCAVGSHGLQDAEQALLYVDVLPDADSMLSDGSCCCVNICLVSMGQAVLVCSPV